MSTHRIGTIRGSLLTGLTALLGVLSVVCANTSGAAAPSGNSFVPGLLVRVPGSHVIYVLGRSNCPRTNCFELLQTNNDGASFINVSPPPIRNEGGSPTGNLSQLVFANAKYGYALEGGYYQHTLFVTSNGGKSWKKQVVAKDRELGGLSTAAHRLYLMTMRCPHRTGNCTDFRLAHSSLSAKRWASTPIPNNTFSEGGFFGSVAAFGSDVWFTEALHSTWLVRSHNGGTTFSKTKVPWPTLVSVTGCALSAASSRALWAECPTGMQVSYYFSGNGGGTWTRILATKQIFGTGGISFDPVSSNLALLDVGAPSFDIFGVSDGARRVAVDGRLTSTYDGPTMVFTNSRDGLSISTPSADSAAIVLRRTLNGGRSWTRVSGI